MQKKPISIPPSLLISALGQVDDVSRCVSMDLKEPGNVLYHVGLTQRRTRRLAFRAGRGPYRRRSAQARRPGRQEAPSPPCTRRFTPAWSAPVTT